MKKKTVNKSEPKPPKELQKAFDRIPGIVKRNARTGKEKARIRKNFESARFAIFGNKKP